MIATKHSKQTMLATPRFDADGVVTYRLDGGRPVHVVYPVAQQAMLGDWFAARYMESRISTPYHEFVALERGPKPDHLARKAARWLREHATTSDRGIVTWNHEFAFVSEEGGDEVEAPWVSGAGQAQALLACLHWWKHSGDPAWRSIAIGASQWFARNWCDETPAGGRVLTSHLLGVYAIRRASELLADHGLATIGERAWMQLRRSLGRYDLIDWSRAALPSRLYLLLRMVPSGPRQVLLHGARVESLEGNAIAEIDVHGEPSTAPGSRLVGIDWGNSVVTDTGPAREILNRQEAYEGRIPEGGTNQNTYLVFDEVTAPSSWAPGGVRLVLDLELRRGATLRIEPRELRSENLKFRTEPVAVLQHDGRDSVVVSLEPELIGRPVPRHLHRFHTEVLLALAEEFADPIVRGVAERWQRADLHDIPHDMTSASGPKTLFTFVNDRCGLKCKMCDIGLENLGIDQEALESVQAAYAGASSLPVLRPSLSVNMIEKARDMDPEVLLSAIGRLGPEYAGSLLQLNGTEPLLYPHYPAILAEAKRRGLRTGITSSGLFLTKEARRLAEAELDELLLSIDGPPAIHDEIRGVPGLFNRIAEGLKLLRTECTLRHTRAPRITISLAVTYENHRSIVDFLDAVRPMRPENVILNHLNFVAPNIAHQHSQKFPSYPIGPSSVPAWEDCLKMDFLELFNQIERALRCDWTEVSVVPYCPTPTRLAWYYTHPHLPMSRARCAAPWASVQIRADGSVGVLARCFDTALGDLRTQSMDEVWHSARMTDFTRFIVDEPFLEPCLRCCGSL